MSTAALASARRRRTTNEPPLSSQNVSNRTTQQELPNSSKQAMPPPPPPQSLTPLQILQLHDNKLKDLEALFVELNSDEYIKNVVEEKINDLMRAKLSTFSNDLDKVKASSPTTNVSIDSYETKLQMLETTIQTNLTIQNARFDEFKNGIQENFNTFKENTNKMIDLLNSKERNISTPSINHSDSNVEKVDMLTKEVNELKLLVIKNQTLALETCTSIINMKDDIKLNNEKLAQLTDNISELSNRQCCEPQCDPAQCDPAQMFLQSFMKNNLFGGANKINMDATYDDDEEYEELDANTNIDINKKLNIDLNNEEVVLDEGDIISADDKIILGTDELVIDENQLREILNINAMEEIDLNNASLNQEEVIDEIINTETTETTETTENIENIENIENNENIENIENIENNLEDNIKTHM